MKTFFFFLVMTMPLFAPPPVGKNRSVSMLKQEAKALPPVVFKPWIPGVSKLKCLSDLSMDEGKHLKADLLSGTMRLRELAKKYHLSELLVTKFCRKHGGTTLYMPVSKMEGLLERHKGLVKKFGDAYLKRTTGEMALDLGICQRVFFTFRKKHNLLIKHDNAYKRQIAGLERARDKMKKEGRKAARKAPKRKAADKAPKRTKRRLKAKVCEIDVFAKKAARLAAEKAWQNAGAQGALSAQEYRYKKCSLENESWHDVLEGMYDDGWDFFAPSGDSVSPAQDTNPRPHKRRRLAF